MRKRFISILLLIVLIHLAAGCNPGSKVEKGSNKLSEKERITITDSIGRVVTVPKNPDYVATIFAPTTQIVCMLGDSEKIVAVSSGNLRDSLFINLYPAVLNARVPTGSNTTNVEELFVEPVPQVIFCESALTMDEKTLETYEKFGVPLVTIDYSSMDDLQYAITIIGEIMGREKEAAKYNEHFDKVFKFTTERVQHIPDHEKKEVYHAINELLRTDIINTLPGDWIPKIGIKPVGVETVYGPNTDKKHFITIEQLFAYDPPYIVINGEDVMDYIAQSEALHSLSAYKNNQIYLLPVGITRFAHTNSIETPLAMLWLSKTIYPEFFEDVDMHEEVSAFYKEIFNADLSKETIEQILSGRGLREMKSNNN